MPDFDVLGPAGQSVHDAASADPAAHFSGSPVSEWEQQLHGADHEGAEAIPLRTLPRDPPDQNTSPERSAQNDESLASQISRLRSDVDQISSQPDSPTLNALDQRLGDLATKADDARTSGDLDDYEYSHFMMSVLGPARSTITALRSSTGGGSARLEISPNQLAQNRAAQAVVRSVLQDGDLDRAVAREALAHGITQPSQVRELYRAGMPAREGEENPVPQEMLQAGPADLIRNGVDHQVVAAHYNYVHPDNIAFLRDLQDNFIHGRLRASNEQLERAGEEVENLAANRNDVDQIARAHGIGHPTDLQDLYDRAAEANVAGGSMTAREAISHFPNISDAQVRNLVELGIRHDLDQGMGFGNAVTRHGEPHEEDLEDLQNYQPENSDEE